MTMRKIWEKRNLKRAAAFLVMLLLTLGTGSRSLAAEAAPTAPVSAAAAVPAAAAQTTAAAAAAQVPAGILMQTTAPLNVRTGPGLQWPVIGVLAKGQTVSVAGTDASGWQIISYGGGYACVSGAYLTPAAAGQAAAAGQTLPDADVLQDPSQAALAQAAAQAAVPAAGLVFIGDSRFVQMEEAVGENPFVWIAENSKGLDWFEEKGAPRADAVIGAGTKVLINLGVNDVRNADRYVSYFNQKAAEWTLRGAVVYYASVNPVWTNPYVTKEQVEAFNQKLRTELAPCIIWLDSYSWIQAAGMRIVDGLHYDETTYRNLYAFYMTAMYGTLPGEGA